MLHSIQIVGFHHKQGSIVEFKYPESASESDLIPYLALPDCVHMKTVSSKQSDFVFFTIELDGSLKHCVASYRQIPNKNKDAEMTRNYV